MYTTNRVEVNVLSPLAPHNSRCRVICYAFVRLNVMEAGYLGNNECYEILHASHELYYVHTYIDTMPYGHQLKI